MSMICQISNCQGNIGTRQVAVKKAQNVHCKIDSRYGNEWQHTWSDREMQEEIAVLDDKKRVSTGEKDAMSCVSRRDVKEKEKNVLFEHQHASMPNHIRPTVPSWIYEWHNAKMAEGSNDDKENTVWRGGVSRQLLMMGREGNMKNKCMSVIKIHLAAGIR